MEVSQVLGEQMALVAIDVASVVAGSASPLTERHAAAAGLTVELLGELARGLTLCEHLPDAVPVGSTWMLGMPALSCRLCTVAFTATHHESRCDGCRRDPADGVLHGRCVAVGPVFVAAALCTRCARPEKRIVVGRRQAVDQVVRLLLERIVDARLAAS